MHTNNVLLQYYYREKEREREGDTDKETDTDACSKEASVSKCSITTREPERQKQLKCTKRRMTYQFMQGRRWFQNVLKHVTAWFQPVRLCNVTAKDTSNQVMPTRVMS
jgi:hypothetical protein